MIVKNISTTKKGNSVITFVDELYEEEKVDGLGQIIGGFSEGSKIACMMIRGNTPAEVGQDFPNVVASDEVLTDKDGDAITTKSGSYVYRAVVR